MYRQFENASIQNHVASKNCLLAIIKKLSHRKDKVLRNFIPATLTFFLGSFKPFFFKGMQLLATLSLQLENLI